MIAAMETPIRSAPDVPFYLPAGKEIELCEHAHRC